MSIDQESFNQRLYEIFKTRGYKPAPKDSKNERTNPQTADVFEFQFVKDGENYGKAWATIDKTSSLNIYYDDKQAGSPPGQTKGVDYDDSWTGLLKHLKQWALSKQLNFGLHDSDRLGDDMRQRDYYKMKEKMNEGYHAVNKTTSYNDTIPNVKVVIQHDKQIGEGEQRWRNVHKIFVENTEGERFAVPTRMPGIARVYGRHVAEGGTPYDDRGKHITSLVEEYTKMAGFVRATRRGEFNESVAKLIAEGVNHHKSLRESLQKMRSHRGYNHYFESWTPPLMEDDSDSSSIAEMFSQGTIDPRIESVLPILGRLNGNIINEIEEVNELDQWARSITEMEQIQEEKRDTHCSAKCCGADVKAEDCGCSPDCEHCNCNAKLDEAITLPEITPQMGDNGSNTQSIISGKKVKEEKNMGSEDDDLADEESGKNHDPKTGKRTKPHPFDPEDDHLKENSLSEGAFGRMHVDAQEMSKEEFAKKHPEMAHAYDDIIASIDDDDLKDALHKPKQGELDLTMQGELDLNENGYDRLKSQVDKFVKQTQEQSDDAREFVTAIGDKIDQLDYYLETGKRKGKALTSIDRSEIATTKQLLQQSISAYDEYTAGKATSARELSRIEAERRARPGKEMSTSADKVTIGTALTGLALNALGESDVSVKGIDKEIKMAYGILNDPRFKGGNMSGAIKAIEGIMPGLSEHPGVKKAIYMTQNEPDNLEEAETKMQNGCTVYNDGSPLSFADWRSETESETGHSMQRSAEEQKHSYKKYVSRCKRLDEIECGGQTFAGKYPCGKDGQWRNTGPTKGKPAKIGGLVGAESKHADDEMSTHQMSDEELADHVGCSTEYAKANREECEEVANEKSQDHVADNMLEDILRLSGRTEYTGESTGKGAGTQYKGYGR